MNVLYMIYIFRIKKGNHDLSLRPVAQFWLLFINEEIKILPDSLEPVLSLRSFHFTKNKMDIDNRVVSLIKRYKSLNSIYS